MTLINHWNWLGEAGDGRSFLPTEGPPGRARGPSVRRDFHLTEGPSVRRDFLPTGEEGGLEADGSTN